MRKKESALNFLNDPLTSKYIHYHVYCTFLDGRIKYLEMRREKNVKTNLYLNCVHRPKCCAKLSILIKDPIKTEKNGRYFHFTQDVTEEMLMNRFPILNQFENNFQVFQQKASFSMQARNFILVCTKHKVNH